MEIIKVKTKTEGQYPKVVSEAGKTYGIKDSSLVTVGESYEIVCTERVVTLKTGKTFTAKDIISVKPVTSKPTATEAGVTIRENMDFKQKGIQEACALNASSSMVEAVSRAWASTEEIKTLTFLDITAQLQLLKNEELNKNRAYFGLPALKAENKSEDIGF